MEKENKGLEECLNRFLGLCRNCKRDYDPSHHPNNYDCPRYKPVRLTIFDVHKSCEILDYPENP